MKRILTSTRYVMILGVIGALVGAITELVYSTFLVFSTLWSALQGKYWTESGGKSLAYSFIQIADLYLIGAVLYLVALGLYELFIDDNLELPSWLQIHTLDDLKDKLLRVLVLVMGVFFLGELVKWKGEIDLLIAGVSISLVIFALAYFLGSRQPKKRGVLDNEK